MKLARELIYLHKTGAAVVVEVVIGVGVVCSNVESVAPIITPKVAKTITPATT